MDSKFTNTKNLEKEGKAAGGKAKPMSKVNLIQNSRDKLYQNLKTVYQENANAPELPAAAKKKPANDIIKKNKAATVK